MDKQELIIPVRFDVGKVPQVLGQVAAAGKKAGDDTAKGFQGATDASKSFFNQMAGMQAVEKMAALTSSTMQSMGQNIKASGDYLRDVAKGFADLRKSMQEVAALRGQAGSNAFTIEEVRKAQAANLSPQARRDFQAEFLNYAGSQVGPQAGAKLTEAQGEEFGNRVAQMMQESGINPKIGAELAGSMLEQSKGPQDVDQLMGRFSKTFQVLQKGRVPLSRALPELSQIMSMGVSPEDAAKMFSIVSPAAAGQEGVAVQAALRAVQEMKNKGTGEEFGVKQGMGQYDAVKAFGQNIADRKAKLMAGGDSEQLASDKVMAELAEKKVAADVREARGLVHGFGTQGIGLGGFQRFEQVETETPADFEEKLRRQYESSDEGRATKRDNALAMVTAERGMRQQALMGMMRDAEIAVVGSGSLERPEGLVDQAMTYAGEKTGQGDRKAQEIRALTARNIKGGLSGYAAGRELLAAPETPGGPNRDIMLNQGRGLSDDFLAKMAGELERMRKLAEDDAKRKENPAISAPPPSPSGRM